MEVYNRVELDADHADEAIARTFQTLGYDKPTLVQEEAIRVFVSGKDVCRRPYWQWKEYVFCSPSACLRPPQASQIIPPKYCNCNKSTHGPDARPGL